MIGVIPYRELLGLLTGIFALRVILQFVLQFQDTAFLPQFDLWHSSTMPYAVLLTMQCFLLLMMMTGAYLMPPKSAHPRLGAALTMLGWLYVSIMLVRLVVGTFNLNAHSWFDGAVSTAFHFGLAAYVLILGSAIKGAWRDGKTPPNSIYAKYLAYPVLLLGGYVLFNWLVETGSPLLFSAYLSVLVAALGILLHETFAPNREEWRPSAEEVLNDGLFLALVQVALPSVLKALALVLIVRLAQSGNAPLSIIWPHQAPILVQVMMMLLISEFFRYWIHRKFHHNRLLWKVHAVHHASGKLYTVNVGRFHPLDKALQFLGDTLPFLLLGVSSEVFATYFVLYAVNGFYQHSNSDVRLGPFNWIIAGPELHRWHHSAKISEAHSNYGNNLIIWDAVFGTRFLPKDKQVVRVGIGNTDWPNGFLKQMAAPFTTPTETRPKALKD